MGLRWLEEDDLSVFLITVQIWLTKICTYDLRDPTLSTVHVLSNLRSVIIRTEHNVIIMWHLSVQRPSDEELSAPTSEPGTTGSPFRSHTCKMRETQTHQWLSAAEIVEVNNLSFSPAMVQCPTCQQHVTTEIQHKVGKTSFLLCYLSIMLGWVTKSHNVIQKSDKLIALLYLTCHPTLVAV